MLVVVSVQCTSTRKTTAVWREPSGGTTIKLASSIVFDLHFTLEARRVEGVIIIIYIYIIIVLMLLVVPKTILYHTSTSYYLSNTSILVSSIIF